MNIQSEKEKVEDLKLLIFSPSLPKDGVSPSRDIFILGFPKHCQLPN